MCFLKYILLRDVCCLLFLVVQLLSHVCPTHAARGPQPTRLLCPWDFPGKNTEVDCSFLLWGIFLTQESNLCLLHRQADSLPRSHQGSPLFSLLIYPVNIFSVFYPKLLCEVLNLPLQNQVVPPLHLMHYSVGMSIEYFPNFRNLFSSARL